MLDDDIDAILKRGAEKTAELNNKFNKLGLDDLQNLTSDASPYTWNGQDYGKKITTDLDSNGSTPQRDKEKN